MLLQNGKRGFNGVDCANQNPIVQVPDIELNVELAEVPHHWLQRVGKQSYPQHVALLNAARRLQAISKKNAGNCCRCKSRLQRRGKGRDKRFRLLIAFCFGLLCPMRRACPPAAGLHSASRPVSTTAPFVLPFRLRWQLALQFAPVANDQ